MRYAVLPCNGLDKPAGPLAREAALWLVQHHGGELICPVLLSNSPDRYARVAGELPLLVIDGCATQCATKLATRLALKIARKLDITEQVKCRGVSLCKSLSLGPDELNLAGAIGALIIEKDAEDSAPAKIVPSDYPCPSDYLEVVHDKFLFKIPASGYFFNENDVWVQINACNNRVRIGISDFIQQQLTDISFVGLPAIGNEVDQFGEAGYVESVKATMELVCPVSGRVVAVNKAVSDAPELINQQTYESGWIVELEPREFTADCELLVDGPSYAEIIKKKAAEYS